MSPMRACLYVRACHAQGGDAFAWVLCIFCMHALTCDIHVQVSRVCVCVCVRARAHALARALLRVYAGNLRTWAPTSPL
jgi:hypothetical protein